MSARTAGAAPAQIDDCWNRIGVRGDHSCKELQAQVHCRNCPVFAAGASALLDSRVPAQYLTEWTRHFARPARRDDAVTDSVLLFRLGLEWLALPTAVFEEVAEQRTVHSLPDKRDVVQGLVNVRGELLVCVSLGRVLGIPPAPAPQTGEHRVVLPRMLVVRHDKSRTVFPVDEVHGIHRFHSRELRDPPATVVHAMSHYTRAVLPWRKQTVGVLDDGLLFHSINRSLSSASRT